MLTTATIQELNQALTLTNKTHGYQLSFNRIEQKTKNRVLFTLKSPSKVNGARTSATGRNLAKASWHAHGHFFDILFELNDKVQVTTGRHKITANGGNWQDFNIGSFYHPVMMSQTSIGH